MTAAHQLRWGIIGTGDVVWKKSGPSIQATGGSVITRAMRRDRNAVEEFARAFSVPVATTNAEAILVAEDVDIVYVATPPGSHRNYVVAAARAGKHCLVEKPMALSAAEAAEMVGACRDAGVELFVAYYRRFQPHVVKMRSLIGDGAIGTPLACHIDIAEPRGAGPEWRSDPTESGGGRFVDVGSHRIDVMISLLGPPIASSGFGATTNPHGVVEELAAISLRFQSGALGTVVGDFASGRSADRFSITGTAGMIEAERLDSHQFLLRRDDGEEAIELEPYPAPHTGLIAHIEAVLRGASDNGSSGADGALTEQVFDNAVRDNLH